MRITTQWLCAVLMVLGLGSTAQKTQAVDVFNNLSQSYDVSVSMNANAGGNWPYNAEAFVPTVGNDILVDATLVLYLNAIGTTTGTYGVEIWSNTGAVPDTKLFDVASGQSVAGLTTSPTQVTFTPVSPIQLTAGTTYWLVLNTSNYTGTKAIQSVGTNSGSGVGITSSFMSQKDVSNVWGANFGSSHMSASINAVPEPSTWALAALATGTLAFARNRRRKA